MNGLFKILDLELELYKKELGIAKRRLEFLKSDDIASLEQTIREENDIIQLITDAERKRISYLEKTGAVNISELIEKTTTSSDSEKLLWYRENITLVLNEIKEINEVSAKIVEISTGVITSMVNLLTGNKEIGYKKDRQKQSMPQNTLLNKKI